MIALAWILNASSLTPSEAPKGQLTDSTGAVTFARTYDPYGVTTTAAGSSASGYGFTNEYHSQGLIYLRARHYAPGMGRFLTRDTWPGEANRPHSLNRWNYVEANPVNFVDPTGHIKEEKGQIEKADLIVAKLHKIYNVRVQKDWGYATYIIPVPSHISSDGRISRYFVTECIWKEGNWRNAKELEDVFEGVKIAAKSMGGPSKFKTAMLHQPIKITRLNIESEEVRPMALPLIDIVFTNYGFDNSVYIIYTTAHEIGHIWDIRSNFRLSNNMALTVGTYKCTPVGDRTNRNKSCRFDINAGKEPPPGDRHNPPYAGTNSLEDWAEAFASNADPGYYADTNRYHQLGPIRSQYVQDQINSIP